MPPLAEALGRSLGYLHLRRSSEDRIGTTSVGESARTCIQTLSLKMENTCQKSYIRSDSIINHHKPSSPNHQDVDPSFPNHQQWSIDPDQPTGFREYHIVRLIIFSKASCRTTTSRPQCLVLSVRSPSTATRAQLASSANLDPIWPND